VKIRLARGKGTQNFPEKELVTTDFADTLCGSLTKDILWHAFVN
jgi:hypothetical protein